MMARTLIASESQARDAALALGELDRALSSEQALAALVRGAHAGEDAAAMREVSHRIVGSPHFAGRAFSSADDFIFRSAQGGSPGNSTTWREINTTHHITRVVRDIGTVKGRQFSERKVAAAPMQFELFNRR